MSKHSSAVRIIFRQVHKILSGPDSHHHDVGHSSTHFSTRHSSNHKTYRANLCFFFSLLVEKLHYLYHIYFYNLQKNENELEGKSWLFPSPVL